MSSNQLVWLITGTTTGIGKQLALAALKRGDKVIATARNPAKIDHSLVAAGADMLQLDVTDSLENLKQVASKAISIHGRVDVLVNNAGYLAIGALEEVTPEETLQQFNTNVFGALNVSRAFLPFMRERKAGTVFFIGSLSGWFHSGGGVGIYNATKYAIRGIAETLSVEVKHLGINVHCIEPGYFRTSLLSPGNCVPYQVRIDDYSPITLAMQNLVLGADGKQPGDPAKLVVVMVDIAHWEGPFKGREIPTTLPLGTDAWQVIKGAIDQMGSVLTDWKDVIESTDLPQGQ